MFTLTKKRVQICYYQKEKCGDFDGLPKETADHLRSLMKPIIFTISAIESIEIFLVSDPNNHVCFQIKINGEVKAQVSTYQQVKDYLTDSQTYSSFESK